MIHPMIIKESKGKLCVKDSEFEKDPRPILWCRDGLYGMIPIEVIKNEIGHLEDLRKLKISNPLIFHWRTVVEIPYETGRTMEKCGEKK